MSQHDDDREPHEAKADEVERELDDMEEQRDRLGGQIEDAGDDWERRQKDERVPGATGEPSDDDGDDDDESSEVSDEDLDFGKDMDTDAVAPEASADDADEGDSDDDESDDDESDDDESDDEDDDADSDDEDDSDEEHGDDSDDDDSDDEDDSDEDDSDDRYAARGVTALGREAGSGQPRSPTQPIRRGAEWRDGVSGTRIRRSSRQDRRRCRAGGRSGCRRRR
jgi:hypothetical protein